MIANVIRVLCVAVGVCEIIAAYKFQKALREEIGKTIRDEAEKNRYFRDKLANKLLAENR